MGEKEAGKGQQITIIMITDSAGDQSTYFYFDVM